MKNFNEVFNKHLDNVRKNIKLQLLSCLLNNNNI